MSRRKKRSLYNEAPIKCRNGDLKISLQTGKVVFSKLRNNEYRPHLPIYKPSAKAPAWEALVKDAFAVNANPARMYKYFHEVMGWILYPTTIKQFHVHLIGSDLSRKADLFNILRTVIGSEKMDRCVTVDRNVDPERVKINARNVLLKVPIKTAFGRGEIRDAAVDIERIAIYEKSGILNCLIDGLKRLISRGRFKAPPECSRVHIIEECATDQVSRFFVERCHVVKDAPRGSLAKDVYGEYLFWLPADEEKMGRINFYRGMEEIGYGTRVSTDTLLYYKNVIINSEGEGNHLNHSGQDRICPIATGGQEPAQETV